VIQHGESQDLAAMIELVAQVDGGADTASSTIDAAKTRDLTPRG
jgi:hypothetical protein